MSSDPGPKHMKYMTDAHFSGLAKELKEKGVDCDTVHKLITGSEDSRIKITDPEIVKFLSGQRGGVTLITLDNELAEYCFTLGIPYIRVQDLVVERISFASRVHNEDSELFTAKVLTSPPVRGTHG